MVDIVPIKINYDRLLVRSVYQNRIHYRPEIIQYTTATPMFSYKILAKLLVVETEEDWMVGGSKMYYEALKLLEQKVRVLKKPVLDGYFVTVWPSCHEILVRELRDAQKAAAS